MKKNNLMTKNNFKKGKRIIMNNSSQLLAEFFNGVVIDLYREYPNES